MKQYPLLKSYPHRFIIGWSFLVDSESFLRYFEEFALSNINTCIYLQNHRCKILLLHFNKHFYKDFINVVNIYMLLTLEGWIFLRATITKSLKLGVRIIDGSLCVFLLWTNLHNFCTWITFLYILCIIAFKIN